MFFRILKKDLRRKKTMNIILLMFVILAAMFVASSVNNIITVINGLDHYFTAGELTCDHAVFTLDRPGAESTEEFLARQASVTSFRTEHCVLGASENLKKGDAPAAEFSGSALFLPIDEAKLNYFDMDDEIIREVKPGEFYAPHAVIQEYGMAEGTSYTLCFGDVTVPVTLRGGLKDALLGSPLMGTPRFLISAEDAAKLTGDKVQMSYIYTDDPDALQKALGDLDGVLFSGSIGMIRTSYALDMVIAGVLLVLSIGLILISFVMLRFTISFTLSEEFREIGVMKAIGLRSSRIRLIYIVKYLGISIAGALIGFAAYVPFGALLLKSVSDNMVLGSDRSLLTGLLCAAGVVALIMLFCYSCTGKIKRLSPIDAVRSGQTGERFGKKRGLRIAKSPLGKTGFLACNDILSSPKQFSVITAVLAIALCTLMMLTNLTNTLRSDRLIHLFGITKTDVYFDVHTEEFTEQNIEDAMTGLGGYLDRIERAMAENGMPAKVMVEVLYNYKISFGEKSFPLSFQQGWRTEQCGFVMHEGTVPQRANELALTPQAAERLGAVIGDTVQLRIGEENMDFLLTGLFSSMNNTGDTGYLPPDAPTRDADIRSYQMYQANFTDHPDEAEMQRRFEKIRDLFDSTDVMDAAQFTDFMTSASDATRALQYLMFGVMLILTVLVVVLMERSFVSQERSEIALMKALGIPGIRIILYHALRFVIAALAAALLASALCVPLTNLCITPVFSAMGNSSSISFLIRPVEIFVIYPAALLLMTALSAGAAALYTNTIKASHTADIE